MAYRLFVAIAYAFAAWLGSGLFVYLGYRCLGRAGQVASHVLGILLCFIPVFVRYFARPDSLPAPAVAALTVGFIVLLDIFVVSPFFLKGSLSFFKSFWDWQLPAAVLVGSILLARNLSS